MGASRSTEVFHRLPDPFQESHRVEGAVRISQLALLVFRKYCA